MKKLLVIITLLCIANVVNSAVLKGSTFDNLDDWTVVQPSDSTQTCYPGSCSITTPGGIWTAIYNGFCQCSDGYTGEPGNNLLYIDQYAGYPKDQEAAYGGSGKCMTFWQESCISYFDNSDGDFGTYLESEQYEVYVKFRFKFQANFERQELDQGGGGFAMKMFHIQHNELPNTPYTYGSNDTNNWNKPAVIGGINQYSTNINFYAQVRCVSDYLTCGSSEQTIYWNLGTVPGIYTSGAFDNAWHEVVLRVVVNSDVGVSDGLVEMWFDGVKKDYLAGYEGTNLMMNDSEAYGRRGLNFVAFGGNSFNYWEASSTNMADREQWYALDDCAITTTLQEALDYSSGISPTYDTPIVTILTESQSTTSATITIIGTLTTDSALTGSGVDVNGVTATADDGAWDEAVEAWTALGVELPIGVTTITATGTDSESETDTDSVSITRTLPPTPTSRGKGYNIKGCSLK